MTNCLWCPEPPHFEVRLGHGWVPACSSHSDLTTSDALAFLATPCKHDPPHGSAKLCAAMSRIEGGGR